MSTKGLMSHKKVAAVTLHGDDAGKLAGKAATLTLKGPWRYKGEAGPFDLTSVDHGHFIVKQARESNREQYAGPDFAGSPRKASSPTAGPARQAASEGDPEERDLPDRNPTAQPWKGGRMAVWRWVIAAPNLQHKHFATQEDRIGHEIAGWLRHDRTLPRNELERQARAGAAQFFKGDAAEYTEVSINKFTVADERKAHKDGTMGSPWAREHILAGDVIG